jgi:predicted TIM-barrel fold metal-dependent hydrolase
MAKKRAEQGARQKIIDTHMHINFERPQSQELAKKVGLRYTPAGLLQDMEENNIVRGLLMSVPGQLEAVKEFAEKYPDRFWVAGSADPEAVTDDYLTMLETEMKAGSIRAIKLYTGYRHYYPDDEACVPVYELALKYDMPVIFHTGDCVSSMARLRFSHPLAIDDLAFRFPALKIVMAHMGNPWIQDAAEVIFKNENVHADLSGLIIGLPEDYKKQYRERLLEQLESAIYYCGAENLMFGTDYCLVSHADSLDFFSRLRIKKKDLKRILFTNALALYGRGENI